MKKYFVVRYICEYLWFDSEKKVIQQYYTTIHVLTSTKYDSIYFLRKFIVILSCIKTDKTEISTIQFLPV